jgi:acyl dehydratase
MRESPPEPAPVEVDEYLIRHWCETLEDGNPLHLDAAYARARGFRGLVAPFGSVMTTFSMPLRWPWPPGEREPPRHIHYEVKEVLDLPVGIVTAIEMECHTPLQVGDHVHVSQRLVEVSPWKRTRLGEGRFWTMDRLYRNQDGDLVVRERMTAFGYGREAGTDPAAVPRGGWSPAVEEMLQGERTGYRPPAFPDRVFEDVAIGEALPTLRMPITVTRCVYLASATRDFSPQHSNGAYARERSRTREVFVNTPFTLGMVGRLLTEWAGPASTIRRIGVALRGAVCAGDDMIVTGTVTGKRVEGAAHVVDVAVTIATQDGPVTPGTATVVLPTRRERTR